MYLSYFTMLICLLAHIDSHVYRIIHIVTQIPIFASLPAACHCKLVYQMKFIRYEKFANLNHNVDSALK